MKTKKIPKMYSVMCICVCVLSLLKNIGVLHF